MKKKLFINLFFIISAFVFSLNSVYSQSVISFQGDEFDGVIPAWVNCAEKNDRMGVKNGLFMKESRKVFLDLEQSENLHDAMLWAENVGIYLDVLGTISGVVSSSQNTVKKPTSSDIVKQQVSNVLKGSIPKGLKKESSFWVLKEYGGNKKLYTYYTVYSMDVKVYEQYVKKALEAAK